MPRTVIAGEPGETWQNTGDKILWQLKVSFFNSCGLCISQANQISTWFPIPYHRGCACTQVPVPPGHSAAPFVDYMEAIRDLDPVQKARVMGKGLWQLVDSGAVDYSEAVTKARVRTLAEVVGRNKLSVADLTKAGLSKARAELAYRSAHTEAISSAELQRRAMVGILRGHGLSDAQIKAALATEIVGRVGIKGKPKPPSPPAPQTPPAPAAKPKLPTKASIEKDLGVPLVVPTIAKRNGDVPIILDVVKTDAALAERPLFHVGPGGIGAAIEGRYEEFAAFLEKARRERIPIEMPEMALNDSGQLVFTNGRHRFAVFRDQGARYLIVAVAKGDALAVARRFGPKGLVQVDDPGVLARVLKQLKVRQPRRDQLQP